MTDRLDPRREYRHRLEERRNSLARCVRDDSRIANLRLLVFAAALALIVIVYNYPQVSWAWLLLPAAAFAYLVVRHGRVLQEKARCETAAAWYEAGLERLEGHWAGRGQSGVDLAPADHLYANDLDLFGQGSLFERLSTARTRAGERTLAAWLLAPASAEAIQARQEAVEELRNRLDLREDLAILGGKVRGAVDPVVLAEWAVAPALIGPRPGLPAWLLPGAVALTLIVLIFTGIAFPLLLTLLAVLFYSRWMKKRVEVVAHAVEEPSRELRVLADALARLEKESFQAPLLTRVQARLREEGKAASEAVARLDRLTDLHEMQHNLIFGPVAFALLWGVHVAHAIERWRLHWGRLVPDWQEALGELEALSSIAAYAFEHPADPFPEIVKQGPLYEGKALGHPLLQEDACVRNDVVLGELRMLMVSGSNMSGKSTLLRTVGANAVLAMAGAPVRAERLRLSALQLGASLRTQDSLWQGTSRFYAELLRLKQMMEAAQGPTPLLFLLDEILHGTNSHDRRIGADAILKALVESNAIGLVTTHDLAVTQVAEELGPRAANVHFTDRIEDGRLTFDYILKPGVVREGNALRLMRNLGLPL